MKKEDARIKAIKAEATNTAIAILEDVSKMNAPSYMRGVWQVIGPKLEVDLHEWRSYVQEAIDEIEAVVEELEEE